MKTFLKRFLALFPVILIGPLELFAAQWVPIMPVLGSNPQPLWFYIVIFVLLSGLFIGISVFLIRGRWHISVEKMKLRFAVAQAFFFAGLALLWLMVRILFSVSSQ